jgi:hypothetical protein
VDDDSIRLALPQELKHLEKHWPPTFGSGLPFLKPLNDLKAHALGKAHNGVALFLEGDAFLALFGSRDADISEKCLYYDFCLGCLRTFDL